MLVPGLLLLQLLSPRDWIQARKKSLQGWRVGGERKTTALDTSIIPSRQTESLLRLPVWSRANEGDSGEKLNSVYDRRAQPVATVCLKVYGVNTGEVKEEASIMIGKGFSSPNSRGIMKCETRTA